MGQKGFLFAVLFFCLILISGCKPQTPVEAVSAVEVNLSAKAAQEATAIIEQARATAMVLKAQAEATALMQEANSPIQTQTPQPAAAVPAETPTLALEQDLPPLPQSTVEEEDEESEYRIELISVGYAAEGGFIIVNFRATIAAANDLWPGRLSITDEVTGTVYDEVPSMPVIGPLIGRPKEEGQLGYVMLVNKAPGLQPGSLVTVQLGQFKQEHVKFEP